MEIVTDIYRGGDIATGYQAVAATLPNDPNVQTTRGTMKIFWKNGMVARVNDIIFWQHEAIRFDLNTKKWSAVFDKFGQAVSDLAKELLMLEATGDYAGTERFFKKWSNTPMEVEESLKRLEHLPVDIEPVYSVNWE
jgi:hypothetical protein